MEPCEIREVFALGEVPVLHGGRLGSEYRKRLTRACRGAGQGDQGRSALFPQIRLLGG